MTDRLVTGEAVELDLRPARLPSRALALAVDLVLQGVLLIVGVFVLSLTVPAGDDALAAAVGVSAIVLVVIGWPVAWETAAHGRSPGKMLLGLRVVRDDGGPVRFRHALVRALVGFFADFWVTFGCGAVFSSLASSRGRRLGDMAAGTFVLRERTPGTRLPPPPAHPAASAWAAGLDLSGVTDDLALSIRRYLGRVHQLDPAVAASLGERLARDTAARIGVPLPGGVHPAAFLATVLAERGRRAMARATSADPRENPRFGPGAGTGPGPGTVRPGPPVTGTPPPAPPPASPPPGPPAPEADRPAGRSGFAPPG